MSLPPFVRLTPQGFELAVKVQPRASKNEAGGLVGQELRVRVTAPPVDDAANEAVVRLLAEVLHCPRGAVQLVRGRTSRHKVIQITGIDPEQAVARLLA